MVIAGEDLMKEREGVVSMVASTEPAMVIAGEGCRACCRCAGAARFNGAGDGDRRRGRAQGLAPRGLPAASTEPAMVIAGEAAPFGIAWSTSGVLQRSRRW